jgi:hypothetical protein
VMATARPYCERTAISYTTSHAFTQFGQNNINKTNN